MSSHDLSPCPLDPSVTNQLLEGVARSSPPFRAKIRINPGPRSAPRHTDSRSVRPIPRIHSNFQRPKANSRSSETSSQAFHLLPPAWFLCKDAGSTLPLWSNARSFTHSQCISRQDNVLEWTEHTKRILSPVIE
ncbi:hypothetical protein CTAM01_07278 [Colletotrichum tamarilloi]|uniref:Uncharacterized protein n=1 Tax=Colletotrichum tamarilloi TaxID=1209934 RepID=A0ABQ9R9Z3_9PEZI|nr:uncharacterized protein CTAM01_07278 [Colletotrichum tamarilloi]KAK1498549.1 hypothetical protein CTAM01_07278 [Colletotrichum tamarilloi]